MTDRRAFLLVIDSVGIGGAPDAARFFNDALPDTGANTVGHIAESCAAGRAEVERSGPLKVPHMVGLGLGAALEAASGVTAPGLDGAVHGFWAAATEHSPGKDTPSGHWELAGVPVPWDWHYFPEKNMSFPSTLIDIVKEKSGSTGVLGNCHASGTEIIARLGAEHLESGWPICYTSADSVFQIAAHEGSFGLDRLLALCEAVAPFLHEMRVGRVIARPFIGTPDTGFTRTANRRDYAIRPPAPVLTNWVQDAGGPVHAIGKIGDIFSMEGIDTLEKGGDRALMQHLHGRIATAAPGSLTFANFVEFDSLYGHRRDVSGYARALEWFDAELGRALAALRAGDLLIVTADHGNDPTWPGTDHTRERVPVLCAGVGQGSAGVVDFADVAASVAAHLQITERGSGRSFL